MNPLYTDDQSLIDALIKKDQQAYRYAVKRFHGSMLSLARSITDDRIADEIVQEAWVSIIRSLPKFEGRSALKTWILRIVANEAKTRFRREKRSVSIEDYFEPSAELANRFNSRGQWIAGREPADWGADSPEDLLSTSELKDCIERTLARLPEAQATTLRLREQEGSSFDEICNILEVSESNVRVLLHRARTHVFAVVEHFTQTGECSEK